MKQADKICINCPAGCRLHVTVDDGGRITVTGNNCPRGERYAVAEMTAPCRTVTCTVHCTGSPHPRVPVRSDRPVPMELIPDLLRTLYRLHLAGPLPPGSRVLSDYQGTGINVVTTGR